MSIENNISAENVEKAEKFKSEANEYFKSKYYFNH